MEVTMRFTLPEDDFDLKHAQRGYDYYLALKDCSDIIFRPARKHGYPDKQVQELVDKVGDDAYDLIDLLEQKFVDILADLNINLID